ncbi:MAG TPA: hypothetical protein DCG12_18120 [Planctomycetaceae bacterium]|nr:hypothetical protein [Planctomycetaceae bacterium]
MIVTSNRKGFWGFDRCREGTHQTNSNTRQEARCIIAAGLLFYRSRSYPDAVVDFAGSVVRGNSYEFRSVQDTGRRRSKYLHKLTAPQETASIVAAGIGFAA